MNDLCGEEQKLQIEFSQERSGQDVGILLK